ncbi:hypothetical protein WN48_09775 [Eufriesea mexicana]|uniref:Uncharacterized protein n=1 Tax=Eufriesea mexicana TaxID=516756 RepID=A0A310SBI3_9HYME|nr:hypothetical protein WN48_09775 [Eufriesea mexicana]
MHHVRYSVRNCPIVLIIACGNLRCGQEDKRIKMLENKETLFDLTVAELKSLLRGSNDVYTTSLAIL